MLKREAAFLKNIYEKKYMLNIILKVIAYIVVIVALYYTSVSDYFAFHSLVESATIVIGLNIFIISKNTTKGSQNKNFMFLGMAFILISVFDFMHMINFHNGVNYNSGKYNLSLQYYLAGIYIHVIAFIIFCILQCNQKRNLKAAYFIVSYYVSSIILFLTVSYFEIFPDCYIESKGFTLFKRISHYTIGFVFISLIIILISKKNKMYEGIPKFLLLSIFFIGFSGICFALYENYNDLLNVLGHIFKLVSIYFSYKAIVENALKKPYNALFYKLTETNNSLEARTIDLEKINKKLNESKKNYQTLLDFLPYAMFAHCDGKFVFVNNAALKLLKLNHYSDILGREVLEFVHHDFHELVKGRMEKVYNERQANEQIEIKMLARDGEVIDVETKAVPYVFKDKQAGLTVVGDIRERKYAEEKERALKEAKEYDRIKNEFMANISHELRTPLNVIFGAVQLIEYYSDNDSMWDNKKNVSKYSKSMRQNCYRMLRLVNNLIDLTKIDSGFLKPNMHNNNIVSIVEDITLSVAEYIESKDISIQFDTDTEEKYLACDCDLIERVILNLLSNAVKFTEAGGSILVNIYDKEEYVLITVKDTGIGIPDDKLQLIFDRFRQVDKSLARNTEGSGIGLSLVKSLVELHGGSISLKSKIDEGSEFTIKLPVTLTAEDEVAVTRDIPQGKVERIHIEFSDIYS